MPGNRVTIRVVYFLLYQFFTRLRRRERKRSLNHHRWGKQPYPQGTEPDLQLARQSP
jgi:hypothetical protein